MRSAKERGASTSASENLRAVSAPSISVQSMTTFCAAGARPFDEAECDAPVGARLDGVDHPRSLRSPRHSRRAGAGTSADRRCARRRRPAPAGDRPARRRVRAAAPRTASGQPEGCEALPSLRTLDAAISATPGYDPSHVCGGSQPKRKLIPASGMPAMSVDQVSPSATGKARVRVPVVTISPADSGGLKGSFASSSTR